MNHKTEKLAEGLLLCAVSSVIIGSSVALYKTGEYQNYATGIIVLCCIMLISGLILIYLGVKDE